MRRTYKHGAPSISLGSPFVAGLTRPDYDYVHAVRHGNARESEGTCTANDDGSHDIARTWDALERTPDVHVSTPALSRAGYTGSSGGNDGACSSAKRGTKRRASTLDAVHDDACTVMTQTGSRPSGGSTTKQDRPCDAVTATPRKKTSRVSWPEGATQLNSAQGQRSPRDLCALYEFMEAEPVSVFPQPRAEETPGHFGRPPLTPQKNKGPIPFEFTLAMRTLMARMRAARASMLLESNVAAPQMPDVQHKASGKQERASAAANVDSKNARKSKKIASTEKNLSMKLGPQWSDNAMLILYGATGVKQGRTQKRAHLRSSLGVKQKLKQKRAALSLSPKLKQDQKHPHALVPLTPKLKQDYTPNHTPVLSSAEEEEIHEHAQDQTILPSSPEFEQTIAPKNKLSLSVPVAKQTREQKRSPMSSCQRGKQDHVYMKAPVSVNQKATQGRAQNDTPLLSEIEEKKMHPRNEMTLPLNSEDHCACTPMEEPLLSTPAVKQKRKQKRAPFFSNPKVKQERKHKRVALSSNQKATHGHVISLQNHVPLISNPVVKQESVEEGALLLTNLEKEPNHAQDNALLPAHREGNLQKHPTLSANPKGQKTRKQKKTPLLSNTVVKQEDVKEGASLLPNPEREPNHAQDHTLLLSHHGDDARKRPALLANQMLQKKHKQKNTLLNSNSQEKQNCVAEATSLRVNLKRKLNHVLLPSHLEDDMQKRSTLGATPKARKKRKQKNTLLPLHPAIKQERLEEGAFFLANPKREPNHAEDHTLLPFHQGDDAQKRPTLGAKPKARKKRKQKNRLLNSSLEVKQEHIKEGASLLANPEREPHHAQNHTLLPSHHGDDAQKRPALGAKPKARKKRNQKNTLLHSNLEVKQEHEKEGASLLANPEREPHHAQDVTLLPSHQGDDAPKRPTLGAKPKARKKRKQKKRLLHSNLEVKQEHIKEGASLLANPEREPHHAQNHTLLPSHHGDDAQKLPASGAKPKARKKRKQKKTPLPSNPVVKQEHVKEGAYLLANPEMEPNHAEDHTLLRSHHGDDARKRPALLAKPKARKQREQKNAPLRSNPVVKQERVEKGASLLVNPEKEPNHAQNQAVASSHQKDNARKRPALGANPIVKHKPKHRSAPLASNQGVNKKRARMHASLPLQREVKQELAHGHSPLTHHTQYSRTAFAQHTVPTSVLSHPNTEPACRQRDPSEDEQTLSAKNSPSRVCTLDSACRAEPSSALSHLSTMPMYRQRHPSEEEPVLPQKTSSTQVRTPDSSRHTVRPSALSRSNTTQNYRHWNLSDDEPALLTKTSPQRVCTSDSARRILFRWFPPGLNTRKARE